MKLSLKPFSKGLRSLEAAPQVARRSERNSLLKPGVRPGFQLKQTKRERPPVWVVFLMSVLGTQRDCALCGVRFYFLFSLIFARAKIKRGFRALRSAARFHLDGPACAAGPRRASGPDPISHTRFIRALRGNKDSGLWAAGGEKSAALFFPGLSQSVHRIR